MIIVEGYVRMSGPDAFEDVRPEAEAQIAASRAESGCIDYIYAIDTLDPTLMRVLERWESWDALETHFKQPHMATWRAALARVKIVERRIRAHEVTSTRDV